MIRTIFEVLRDIRWFFAIVLLVIVGFSQFYFIMFNMKGDAPFASSLGATFVEVFLFNLGVYVLLVMRLPACLYYPRLLTD